MGAAAAIALLGLLNHVPVWLACLRGAGALVAVLVLMRLAGMVAGAVPRPPQGGEGESTSKKAR